MNQYGIFKKQNLKRDWEDRYVVSSQMCHEFVMNQWVTPM